VIGTLRSCWDAGGYCRGLIEVPFRRACGVQEGPRKTSARKELSLR